MAKKKIVCIVGTTGVGKSDLSIEIAQRYNGEIINADSMQMYKDVPIITNKHPIPERKGIPHHVMNHINWDEEYFIHRFEKECLETINDIHQRGKLPIVVGGTHYYLQVLFNKILSKDNETDMQKDNDGLNQTREPTEDELKILNSKDGKLIYDTLKQVDPVIASKYHPNDERRVQRMLEIFYTTGTKPSDTFQEQTLELKFDTLFFWLYSEPNQLNERLDTRVDKMLSIGGMDEINQLYSYFQEKNLSIEKDCENGVWQVIGFKEFLPWLVDNEEKVSLESCIERMKIRTRQYAKRQVKWIKKMLIPDINGEQIYVLNATDLTNWHQLVGDRAMTIMEPFLKDENIITYQAPTELKSLLSKEETIDRKRLNDCQQFVCPVCKDANDKNLIAIGKELWEKHLKGRRHKSNLTRGSKKREYELYRLKKLEQEQEQNQAEAIEETNGNDTKEETIKE